MSYQKKIEYAYDEISGKQIRASEDLRLDGYQYRNDYADGNIKPICIECSQTLLIAGGLKQRPHFRHFKGLNNCVLIGSWTPKEIQVFNQICKNKESDRHKELKNKIAEKLNSVKGVKNIWVDDRFISDKKDSSQKKKPDVYCEFNGKKIVFEIQLSNLSNKYIRSRYHFYKRNGIFLVWVLEDMDLIRENKNTMSLDIKYLAQHQNLFKFDENAPDFQLNCSYKDYFIDFRTVKAKWREKAVSLISLKFSTPEYQVFYKNGIQNKGIEENKLQQLKKEDRKRIRKQQNEESKQKVEELFQRLRQIWDSPSAESIAGLSQVIIEFDAISKLRDEVDKKKQNGIPFFHRLVRQANYEHLRIIDLILFHSADFGFDVNRNTDDGETIIQSLANNNKLHHTKKEFLYRILNSGYRLQDNDMVSINSLDHDCYSEDELTLLRSTIDKAKYTFDVEEIFKNWKFICLLSSIKENKFIGYAYAEGLWLAFANNAIDNYKHHWEAIEECMKINGIWEKIVGLDKKGSFRKKHEQLKSNLPDRDTSLDHMLSSLFPEITVIRRVDDYGDYEYQ